MYYLILGRDKSGAAALRQKTRPAHLAYWQGLIAYVPFGGAFTDEAGAPRGTMLVAEAADLAAARLMAKGDPYYKAGLFASVEVMPWNWVLHAPDRLS